MLRPARCTPVTALQRLWVVWVQAGGAPQTGHAVPKGSTPLQRQAAEAGCPPRAPTTPYRSVSLRQRRSTLSVRPSRYPSPPSARTASLWQARAATGYAEPRRAAIQPAARQWYYCRISTRPVQKQVFVRVPRARHAPAAGPAGSCPSATGVSTPAQASRIRPASTKRADSGNRGAEYSFCCPRMGTHVLFGVVLRCQQ